MKRKHLNRRHSGPHSALYRTRRPRRFPGSVGGGSDDKDSTALENFLSMPVFSDRLVRLVCRDIALEGRNLSAKELSGGMLVLTGRICSVSYKRRGETEEE